MALINTSWMFVGLGLDMSDRDLLDIGLPDAD